MTEGIGKYKVVVGLEVHAQLSTNSKIFCEDPNQYGSQPNSNISAISLAHPGSLPKLNKNVLNSAIKLGLACNCKINPVTFFDRKNYFYPDLPKGYQITQDKAPICLGGFLPVRSGKSEQSKKIALTKIHMEEDAGKSMHTNDADDTLVDYNRAGVPLLEIVTEPVIESSREASSFLMTMRQLLRYLKICDGDMEKGSLRCDANISLMPMHAKVLGNKVEIKNMNSAKNVQVAIDHEIKRQTLLLEAGESIVSETRDFDANTGTTSSLRVKENLNDYRYFPDPDLAPVSIIQEHIDDISKEMPPLPWEVRRRFIDTYGLPAYDADQLSESLETALFYENAAKYTDQYKSLANWMMGKVKAYLNEESIEISALALHPKQLAELVDLVHQKKISKVVASKELFPLLIDSTESAYNIAESANLLQKGSSDSIQEMINEILSQNTAKVTTYKKGKKGLIGFFMGEVMKKSNGKIDPEKAKKLLKEALD